MVVLRPSRRGQGRRKGTISVSSRVEDNPKVDERGDRVVTGQVHVKLVYLRDGRLQRPQLFRDWLELFVNLLNLAPSCICIWYFIYVFEGEGNGQKSLARKLGREERKKRKEKKRKKRKGKGRRRSRVMKHHAYPDASIWRTVRSKVSRISLA